jgi:aldehyde dehydrogenase (NAD+)
MREHRAAIAELVALETGKSRKDALGETDAAIEMGFFVAGEGRRSYGYTTTSAVPNKTAMVVRQPLGVAGLIIAANTPIANVAWKAFPALLCGNAAILKASEDTPLSAWAFGLLAREAGVPAGVYATLHGFGEEAGAPLVQHPDVAVVSFTGSRGRALDRPDCGEATGQDLPGAWRQESAHRLRRRRPGQCRDLDAGLGVQQCRPALRRRQPHHRLRRGLRQFSDAGGGDRALRSVRRTDDYGPVINEEQIQLLAAGRPGRRRRRVVLSGGRA